ncbi:AraC family transcriptional regulator [Clostridium oryzae]|uniref:Melibiose operon regulatory protein n=1 Tax=Clostridium oryzae TaxID=1450648 RepID=A0A1V4IS96_9CLOT|nr:AraC family transcriptional regulator [Clostridium oryzae]OPJ62690.1 melibiose operon regulatory protein [Clostridium oryzae]
MQFYYENRLNVLYDSIQMSIYENTDFSYAAHWHNDFELAYVKEGSIMAGVNNEKYFLESGDMLILSSGDIHYYDSTNRCSKIMLLVFSMEFIGLPAKWPPKGHFKSPLIKKDVIRKCNLSKIENILMKINAEKNANINPYSEFFIKAYLNEICGILLRNLNTDSSSKNENNYSKNLEILQQVLIYIEENFSSDISLRDIAAHCNIDPYNLSKTFNNVTGTNLKTYLNTLRVLKAENMILNTDKSLTDIALESGFNSIRSFNRAFKSIKSITPSSLRGK